MSGVWRTAWAGVGFAAGVLATLAALHLEAAVLLASGLAVAALIRLTRAERTARNSEAEPEARERHSVAEALLANIPDPVILVDQRVVVLEANSAAQTLLPRLKLRYPLSFALRTPEILDGIEEVLRSGQPLRTSYATRVPTERAFEVQIGALPMPDAPGGGQPNVVLYWRDLTSARRLETMRVDFVANASHELRTPLASLLGFIDTLQGPARDDAKARERFLGIMRMQAQRMTRLIDDLLSLSRIELREHVPPTAAVDLAAVARQIVEALAPLAAEEGIAVTLDAPDAPYLVTGDRDELLRVVENLVENAVKYGGAAVTVSVDRLAPEGGRGARIALGVRDEGPGIAEEHIPRLTERFYRVEDGASGKRQRGTGLGLAIVKHAVNHHRGTLAIESAPGAGTNVRIVLPSHVVTTNAGGS